MLGYLSVVAFILYCVVVVVLAVLAIPSACLVYVALGLDKLADWLDTANSIRAMNRRRVE